MRFKDEPQSVGSDALLERLFGLDGQIAVVVGGAGRIGSALACALGQAGADVGILDLNHEAAEELAQRIAKTSDQRALALRVDTTCGDELNDAVRTIEDRLGPPTILVNSAQFRSSGFYSSNVEEYPQEAWDRVLAVNLTGVHLACQAFGRSMMTHRGGSIVNISSTYGVVSPDPRIYGTSGVNSPISYGASKAGVIQLTRYLAVHWRQRNIRVNCLAPGGVLDGQTDDFVESYCARTPLGRMARPEDYQGPLLFAVSRASAYMTGAVVTVDGGWTAW